MTPSYVFADDSPFPAWSLLICGIERVQRSALSQQMLAKDKLEIIAKHGLLKWCIL